MEPITRLFDGSSRADRVLARVRQRQLELAMQGRVEDSARFARRAYRVRRQLRERGNACTCCAA